MVLLELPDALRENILRFSSVHSPDRLSLACTCRQLLQEVEAFSKKELDRITREHNVDTDWFYRAGMQAVATGQQETGWYIPSSVSQRRMLRSAYQTHIYSLGTDPSQEWTGVLSLAMHPDGKRMLSGGHGNARDSTILRLWDVQVKRCIRSLIGHSSYAGAVCFSAGCAISQAWEEDNLRIWDLSNGTCRHSIETNLGGGKHAASNEEVFMPNVRDIDGLIIDSINIHTGVIRSSSPQTWCMSDRPVELHLCGNILLAAVIHNADNYEDEKDEEEEAAQAGIYMLDRSSLELKNYFAGKYLCINTSAATGDVVAEKADGRYDVFQVVDDDLVIRTSFRRRPLSLSHQNNDSILLVHDSRAYVNSYRAGTEIVPCTEVYNILTGDFERTLWHPSVSSREGVQSACCLVAGKKELFCGFNSKGSIRNATSAIKVYLLE
jgi:hypothetical protein